MFTQNEFKDSQFWYLNKIPETEYGFIGSKKYISEDKVLTIQGKLSHWFLDSQKIPGSNLAFQAF